MSSEVGILDMLSGSTEAADEPAEERTADIGPRPPVAGADFRSGAMGWTSSAAISAGWHVSPLRIDARTGAITAAVLFDGESDTVLMVDGDAAPAGSVEEGEQGEAE